MLALNKQVSATMWDCCRYPTLSRFQQIQTKPARLLNITPEAPSTAASPEPSSLAGGPSETAEASSVPCGSMISNVSGSVVRGTAAYGTAPPQPHIIKSTKPQSLTQKINNLNLRVNNSHHLLQILLHRQLPLLKCSAALCPLESLMSSVSAAKTSG